MRDILAGIGLLVLNPYATVLSMRDMGVEIHHLHLQDHTIMWWWRLAHKMGRLRAITLTKGYNSQQHIDTNHSTIC
jgi:hypothetical protein